MNTLTEKERQAVEKSVMDIMMDSYADDLVLQACAESIRLTFEDLAELRKEEAPSEDLQRVSEFLNSKSKSTTIYPESDYDKREAPSEPKMFSEQCIRDIIFDSFKKTAIRNVNDSEIIGLSNLSDFAILMISEIANLPQIRANSSKICNVNEELFEALK